MSRLSSPANSVADMDDDIGGIGTSRISKLTLGI
jgi:hypothetical protein